MKTNLMRREKRARASGGKLRLADCQLSTKRRDGFRWPCQILSRKAKIINGFTLIELMVVVVILGILAATIIPQFIGTTYDAKVSAAKSNIAELQSAVERFYVHMDRYPTTEEGLKVLIQAPADGADKWHGPYIQRLREDPWGHAYQYLCPGTHNPGNYDIWSRGADGADGGTEKNLDIGNW